MTPEQDQAAVREAYKKLDRVLTPLTPAQRERVLRMIDELLNRQPGNFPNPPGPAAF